MIGGAAVLLFILLRILNIYGILIHGRYKKPSTSTISSFHKVTKYPPSLQFILLTVGFAFLFLAVAEKSLKGFGKAIIQIGRVPMFF
jgi:uncharacterized membrane protein